MSCLSFQILKNWLEHKRDTSVKGLINTVRHWEKDGHRDWYGYISREVWKKLRHKVDLDSVPSEETVGMTDIV